MKQDTITRRDFMKVSGFSAVTALWLASGLPTASASGTNVPTPIRFTARSRVDDIAQDGHYIAQGDDCTITDVRSDGSCEVAYPTSSGKKSNAFWLEWILPIPWFERCAKPYVATGKFRTYQTAYSTTTCGSVYSDDTFYILASENGTYYVLYPISSGGYRIANAQKADVAANAREKGSSSSSNSAAISLSVVDYKQSDSRWAAELINPGYEYSKTIKQIGCLTCAIAELLTYHSGKTVMPINARNMLSYDGNNLVWSSVSGVGLSFTDDYGCQINQSIMKKIYEQLSQNNPVIIGGKNNSGQHWVVVTGYTSSDTSSFSSKDFQINDPNSTSRKTLKAFFCKYPTVRRLIF